MKYYQSLMLPWCYHPSSVISSSEPNKASTSSRMPRTLAPISVGPIMTHARRGRGHTCEGDRLRESPVPLVVVVQQAPALHRLRRERLVLREEDAAECGRAVVVVEERLGGDGRWAGGWG